MRDHLKSLFRPGLLAASEYVVGAPDRSRCKLNQNESPFDLPIELKDGILAEAAQIPFNRYPTEQPRRLAERLARYSGVDPNQVIVTNGSNDFIHTLCIAFVGTATNVVLPTPMFSVFEGAVRLFGGHVVPIASRTDQSFDVAGVVAAQRSEPALTIIACPNNPTGMDLDVDEIEEIVSAAHGFVVVDEAYWEFTERRSAVTLLPRHDNLIVMRTLSKAFGLAAVRIGYAIAGSGVIGELIKARLAFTVDAIAESIACAALARTDLMDARVQTMLEGRRSLEAGLHRIEGVDVLPSVANFVVFRTGRDAGEIQKALQKVGILVRNMSVYPSLRDYLRVCSGSDVENRAFLDALETTLSAPVRVAGQQ